MKREEAAAALEATKKFLEAQSDWTGTCRKCGQTLTGTPKQLREHSCGTVAESQ